MSDLRTAVIACALAAFGMLMQSCAYSPAEMPSSAYAPIERRTLADYPSEFSYDAHEEDLDGCWSYRDGDFESILKFENGRLIVFNGSYGENGEYTSDGYSGSAEYYLTDGGISITDGTGNDHKSGYYSAVITEERLELTLIDGDEITGSGHDTAVSYERTDETPYIVIGIDRNDEKDSRISLPTVLNPEFEGSADFVRIHATLVNEAVAHYESISDTDSGMIWLTQICRDADYVQTLTWKYDTSPDGGSTSGLESVVYDITMQRTLTVVEILEIGGIDDIEPDAVSAAVIREDVTEVYVVEDGSAYFYRYNNGNRTVRGEMFETFDGIGGTDI